MDDGAGGGGLGPAQPLHGPHDDAQQNDDTENEDAAIEPAETVFQGLEIVVQECVPGLGGVTEAGAAGACVGTMGVSFTFALLRGDTITTLTRRLAARPLAVSLDATG